MQAKLLLCFLCSICLFSFSIHAQTDTSATDSTEVSEYLDASNARAEFFIGDAFGQFQKPDSALLQFQKFNAARTKIFPYTYLGVLGSASQPVFFEWDRKQGFTEGREQYLIFENTLDSLRFYRTNTPFTDLYYVLGTGNEQLFHFRHTQNFSPQGNIALNFEKMASDGKYLSNKKQFTNFDLTSWYETKNKRYHAQAALIYNNNNNLQNGGIEDENVFESDEAFTPAVYRTTASDFRKSLQAEVIQTYAFAKKISYQLNDSVSGFYDAPFLEIKHQFRARDFDRNFEDIREDTSYYEHIYAYADTLRDESDVDGFSNKLQIGNPEYKKISADSTVQNHFRWNVFAEQQHHEVADASGNYNYDYLLAGLNIEHHISSLPFSYFLHAESDITNTTYEIQAGLSYFNKYVSLSAHASAAQFLPSIIEQHYYGFAYRWDNDFENISLNNAEIILASAQYHASLSARVFQFKNYISIPFQQNDLQIYQLNLQKDFYFNHFFLLNNIGFQKPSNIEIINIPLVLGNHSFIYQTQLFKSALTFAAGIDISYTSQFNLSEYNIVTGLFSLQTETPAQTKPSFYPYIDAYMNFEIRTFRFFLKLENAAQGFPYAGYYEAVNYPMQARSFKLGVSWYLFY